MRRGQAGEINDDVLANLDQELLGNQEYLTSLYIDALLTDNLALVKSLYIRQFDLFHPVNHEGVISNPLSLCQREKSVYNFLRSVQGRQGYESSTGGSSSASSNTAGYRNLMQPFLDKAKTSIKIQYTQDDTSLIDSFNTPQKAVKQSDGKSSGSSIKLSKDKDKFLVPHFRGINFNRKFFDKIQRRNFGITSHVGKPIHSLTSFENAGLIDRMSSTEFSPEESKRLSELDRRIHSLFNSELNKEGAFKQIKGPKVFSTARNRMQQRYTNLKNNSIDILWEQISSLVQGTEFADLRLCNNPYVSTGKTPEHALRYALGLSFLTENKATRADPRYRYYNGQAKYRIIGMLYIVLHKFDEYNKANPSDVLRLNKSDQIGAHVNYLNETEMSFTGGIEGENVYVTMPILYPSFKKDWEPYYQEMYGLSKGHYDNFKLRLTRTRRHYSEHKQIKNEIREHLKSHYSAIALTLAKHKAEELGKKLVYIDPIGQVTPYNERKLTGASKSLSGELAKNAKGKSSEYKISREWEGLESDNVVRKIEFSPMKKSDKAPGVSRSLFDRVTEISNLTHHNILYLINKAFVKAGLNPDETDVAVISRSDSFDIDRSLRDAILKFLGKESSHNCLSIALCDGYIDTINGIEQIVGNSHWMMLHVRRNLRKNGIDYHGVYFMDSMDGDIPIAISRVLEGINDPNGILMQDFASDFPEGALKDRIKLELDKKVTFAECKKISCAKQEDGYSCGYHTVFNMAAIHRASPKIEEALPQDGQMIDVKKFISDRKRDLQTEFNNTLELSVVDDISAVQIDIIAIIDSDESYISKLEQLIAIEDGLIANGSHGERFFEELQFKLLYTKIITEFIELCFFDLQLKKVSDKEFDLVVPHLVEMLEKDVCDNPRIVMDKLLLMQNDFEGFVSGLKEQREEVDIDDSDFGLVKLFSELGLDQAREGLQWR